MSEQGRVLAGEGGCVSRKADIRMYVRMYVCMFVCMFVCAPSLYVFHGGARLFAVGIALCGDSRNGGMASATYYCT